MKLIFSIVALIVFISGLNVGLLVAHITVEDECKRVGGFYIGSPYNCIHKEKLNEK